MILLPFHIHFLSLKEALKMSQKILKLLLNFSVVVTGISVVQSVNYLRRDHRHNFSLLLDFACAIAKDEFNKNPEMRTIGVVELKNKFPPQFSREVLKCLPQDVSKVILNPHTHYNKNKTLILPKESMIIYVADIVQIEVVVDYTN